MRFSFLKSGVPEIDPSEAQRREQAQGAVIVDVRENAEWREGHIAEAKHIPLGELQARMHEIVGGADIIFVCRSGNRSTTAARAFMQAGHSNVASLTGGMQAWKRAGLPVTR